VSEPRPSDWSLSPSPQPSPRNRGEGVSTAIGVISGTSMDGIDVALIESDGEARLEAGPAATFAYPKDVAQRLRAVVADLSEAQAPQLELERDVTDAHVAAVETFLERFSVARERVALVGLHGQTILHRARRLRLSNTRRWPRASSAR
jgi:anhydro-N-acetylmuramic acid kinase